MQGSLRSDISNVFDSVNDPVAHKGLETGRVSKLICLGLGPQYEGLLGILLKLFNHLKGNLTILC